MKDTKKIYKIAVLGLISLVPTMVAEHDIGSLPNDVSSPKEGDGEKMELGGRTYVVERTGNSITLTPYKST